MKVLIPDKVDKKAIETLQKSGFDVDYKVGTKQEEFAGISADADAMIVRSSVKVDKQVIDAAKKLKIVVRAGVGYDNIDVKYAAEKGIIVENTPFGNTNAAAEHTLTLLMMLAKHVIHSHNKLKQGAWDKKSFEGTEVKGKTLGIIGIGKIGQKVAKVANALEMSVLGFDPYVDANTLKAMGIIKVEFSDLIKKSDYITVHVPLTDKTKNMISTEQFAAMKDGVRILNVARGGVVDEKALEESLKSGKVAAAALDVYAQEPPICSSLLANDRVICTPHLGGSTKEAQINVGLDAANQIIIALKEGKIENCVNGVKSLRK
ncbi:MAG TPA: hydroxyacid dehydrogenase [Candidatus Nanoarchaeia archaeon]|nr:hydroxyacid dehydrogenase [Candidatus Nanoarchaeia archaeon]